MERAINLPTDTQTVVTNCPMLRLSDARFGDMCLLPSRAGELSQSEEKVELRAPYVGC
jgi:hypothetical protein